MLTFIEVLQKIADLKGHSGIITGWSESGPAIRWEYFNLGIFNADLEVTLWQIPPLENQHK